MAHRSMRRAVLASSFEKRLRTQASKVYKAIGMEMPAEQTESDWPAPRTYSGCELVSTFTPSPKPPRLNTVHGPLVHKSNLRLERQVVGFPIVGAAERARLQAGLPSARRKCMEIEDDEYVQANTPYFYPRLYKKKGGIQKRRRAPDVKSTVQKAATMEIEKSDCCKGCNSSLQN